jgi:hypothetical protein
MKPIILFPLVTKCTYTVKSADASKSILKQKLQEIYLDYVVFEIVMKKSPNLSTP